MRFRHLLLPASLAVVAGACSDRAETAATNSPSKPIEELTTEYFAGEWCLVNSTREGHEGSPNINFRFINAKTLAFERATGSGKFGAGSYSWSSEANVFLLRTPPTLMQTASIESATENSFVLGGNIGYTFKRGVCGS